ncbi:MAG: hypothetical protein ACTSVY_06310 [Candidatus Helarchaeota archaeon]
MSRVSNNSKSFLQKAYARRGIRYLIFKILSSKLIRGTIKMLGIILAGIERKRLGLTRNTFELLYGKNYKNVMKSSSLLSSYFLDIINQISDVILHDV